MNRKIKLDGEWRFTLDHEKIGLEQKYCSGVFGGVMTIPGTVSGERLSSEISFSEHSDLNLTDPYKYEGYAWLQRTVPIDSRYETLYNPNFFLRFERTRKTTLFIDGNLIGECDSLCTPHVYNITEAVKSSIRRRADGTKLIEICVLLDNTDYQTPGGHMTSPDTQTNWLGILGNSYIMVRNHVCLDNIQVFPDAKTGSIKITADVKNNTDGINVAISTSYGDGRVSPKKVQTVIGDRLETEYSMGLNFRVWNEFSPVTYDLKLAVTSVASNTVESNTAGSTTADSSPDVYIKTFGFTDLTIKDTKFYSSGQEVFFRGKHDAMLFPQTGCAPCDTGSWRTRFKTAKSYGINLYRFHTCVPPEAAFIAADTLGMYLAPELPFWGTIKPSAETDYLIAEGERILREFGSHPSFVMFSLGNELWGDKDILSAMLRRFKAIRPDIFFTQGSNNFQFEPCELPEDDFFVGVRCGKYRLIRGSFAACDAPQGYIQSSRPTCSMNFNSSIHPVPKNQHKMVNDSLSFDEITTEKIEYKSTTPQTLGNILPEKKTEFVPKTPVISHEIGQYYIYPDYKEIPKFKGVLKPYNFEIFRERLEEAGLGHLAERYFRASGAFAVGLYKNDIESALRSTDLSGFHILDLQDYTGQGTATVGILDAFMDNKGLISPERWREFCSDLVVFATFDKYVYVSEESFKVKITAANYSGKQVFGTDITLRITEGGSEIINLTYTLRDIVGIGRRELAEFEVKLPFTANPRKLKMTISALGVSNFYKIWLYPEVGQQDSKDVIITSDVHDAVQYLFEGQSVLFYPKNIQRDTMIPGTYADDFWNYQMFFDIGNKNNKPLPIGTLGLLIDNKHPSLASFPCEFYSTPQWYSIVTASCSLILDDDEITPIVSVIDNVSRNHKLGLIFEAAVDRGKLLVCMANLSRLGASITANALTESLLSYMNSGDFNPTETLTPARFRILFTA
ncbi:MAG: beta-glucuronidase [Ruminococcus sp.]|jgi:hypothetical protein|nr:beta-glucuronidase [Ruminococcus sp.]